MKKLLLSLIVITVSVFLFAQTPNQFKYQAVLRNTDGTIMAEESVTIVISILKSDLTTSVFNETHNITTTTLGLINLNIGSIEDLSTINWTLDEYFIEISVNGTVIGTSQLLSVPYALHAKTAESVTGTITETDPVYTAWDKSTGISITESQISDLNHFANTDETDPIFTESIASGITATDTANWNKEQGSFTEADPLYSASQAANITVTDIANLGNLSGTNTGDQDLSGKVDVEAGKELSTNDYTDADATKLAAITGTNTGDQDITAMTHSNRTALDAVSGTNTGDQTLATILTGNTSAGSNKITELSDPTTAQDAATKAYVDELKEIIYDELLDAGMNGVVRDVEGNAYKTVKIGNQVWMEENLKTIHYNDGTAIELVTDNTEWSNMVTGAYCWHNNDEASNKDVYGALYNWYAVDTINLCPTGWHVPTDAEWTILTDYLGGVSVAGGALKEVGEEHWTTPNTGATNSSGFTALPGLHRYDGSGTFYTGTGNLAYFWTSSELNSTHGKHIRLRYNTVDVNHNSDYGKVAGFSVRCIKD